MHNPNVQRSNCVFKSTSEILVLTLLCMSDLNIILSENMLDGLEKSVKDTTCTVI